MTTMTLLLIAQWIVFSAFPFYFTTLSGPLRRVHFYVYISLLLLIGGFLGNVYSLPLADNLVISGGNLCYGAFMMTSVLFVWVEKDAFILRHLVRLVILVDLFNIAFSYITQSILHVEGVVNPHGVSPGLFEISTPFIALGGTLIILELFLLLLIFEATKKWKTGLPVTAAIYILSFVLVLVLDGIAFPFIAFGITAEIAAIVFGGLSGKIVMASAFGLTLSLFVLWKRRAFQDYLQTDTVRWRLLGASSAELIREMDRKDRDVRRGDIVFKNSTEGLAIIDQSGTVLKANEAFRTMLDLTDDMLRDGSSSLRRLFHRDGDPVPETPAAQWRGEVRFGMDGRHPGILSITPADHGSEDKTTYVYSLTDISEQKETQDRLEFLATHDQLTGLPNRRALDMRLDAVNDSPHTLIIADLDHFRNINDSYGHGVGDRVLTIICARLEKLRDNLLSPKDIVCRIGGDEFALLIHSADTAFVQTVITQIQQALGHTVKVDDDLEVVSSVTVGVSYKPHAGGHDALLEADAALHEAKRNRRGSVCVYEDRLTAESLRKMKIGLNLKHALARNEIEVHYQPQFDAATHRLKGLEALSRWTDPELGHVSPAEFIPVAEGTGLIEALGEYILERACRDGYAWQQKGFLPVTISVNVSAIQLRGGRFISILPQILARTGFNANALEIEIIESSYIEREAEVTPVLKRLKDMGVSIAIDDFGTGYSSLSYLREMPWSCIKIDRSFITDIPNDEKQCSLTAAIVKLAKVMSFKIVAEGVETKAQLDFLSKLECDLIQGYYFSAALPEAEVAGLLEREAALI